MMDFINENLILVSLTIFVFLMAIFNELKIKEGNICGLSPVQAVKLINQNAVIFDLRNENDFEKKHLLDFYIKGGIIEWERASLPTISEQS